jgi:thioredoxin 2
MAQIHICHQPLPRITDANGTAFGEIADAAKLPLIVDLWAPWRGQCRMVSPGLEQPARDLPGQMKLIKGNVNVSPQLSQRFGPQGVATLLVLCGKRVAASQIGATPPACRTITSG